MLIAKILIELLEVVHKYTLEKECNSNEAHFLLSKTKLFTIPQLYIMWKDLKNPPIGRSIVAGFYSIFYFILTNSLSLVKLLEKAKFNENCYVLQ